MALLHRLRDARGEHTHTHHHHRNRPVLCWSTTVDTLCHCVVTLIIFGLSCCVSGNVHDLRAPKGSVVLFLSSHTVQPLGSLLEWLPFQHVLPRVQRVSGSEEHNILNPILGLCCHCLCVWDRIGQMPDIPHHGRVAQVFLT